MVFPTFSSMCPSTKEMEHVGPVSGLSPKYTYIYTSPKHMPGPSCRGVSLYSPLAEVSIHHPDSRVLFFWGGVAPCPPLPERLQNRPESASGFVRGAQGVSRPFDVENSKRVVFQRAVISLEPCSAASLEGEMSSLTQTRSPWSLSGGRTRILEVRSRTNPYRV